MKEQDEIDKLIEWQEHQNNPGHWINHRPFLSRLRGHQVSLLLG